MTSRRRSTGVAVAAALCAAGTVLAPSAGASGAMTFSVTPGRGPAGTVVTLQDDTPCPPGDTATGSVEYYPGRNGISSQPLSITTDGQGDWAASFTALATSGPTAIQIACMAGQTDVGNYDIGSFDVTTAGLGYWMVSPAQFQSSQCSCASNVASLGDANSYGPSPSTPFAAGIVGLAPDPVTGTGYWLAGADGGVFTFGLAAFHGSLPAAGVRVTDIVGTAPTPDGGGYWLVGADGGVFAFGDARYAGSLPGDGIRVTGPGAVTGMPPTPDGGGYWLVGGDGGVFGLGDALFFGSLPSSGKVPATAVVGIAAHGAHGYWVATGGGVVYDFGDAPAEGDCVSTTCSAPGWSFTADAIVATPVTTTG